SPPPGTASPFRPPPQGGRWEEGRALFTTSPRRVNESGRTGFDRSHLVNGGGRRGATRSGGGGGGGGMAAPSPFGGVPVSRCGRTAPFGLLDIREPDLLRSALTDGSHVGTLVIGRVV